MGVKSKKKAKTRLDAYYRLAKDQGYRARSAFKLIQLNRKYDFLAKARVLVDLCAAPGGWCQVAAKYMPVGSKIVGVDLVPIAPIRGVKTFVGDITDDKTRKMIVTWLKKEPVDCVIHDGAPNVGGVWSRDLFEQNALVLAAAKMASSMLKLNGWFVTKVFRSQDFHKLLWVLKQLFEKVEATKPLASRMESAEIFVVCAGYKAPKHVDPALFNAQKVFSDVGEEKILTPSGLLVTPKSNVPMGYDEFATVSHHVANFSAFLRASDPRGFLRSHHELRFVNDEDRAVLRSKSAKKELVYLCGDLQQVSEADLRRLLRWREQLLKEQAQQQLAQSAAPDKDEEAEGDEGEEDEQEEEDDDEKAADDKNGDDDDNGDGDEVQPINFDDPEDVTRIARELLELRKRKAKEMKKKQKKVVDRKLKQIKGLINYDPNAGDEHLDEMAIGHDEDEDGHGQHNDHGNEDGDDEPGFTVERLAMIDESQVARVMDEYWQEPEDKGNDPLNPVVSADLTAQADWDVGDEDEGDAGEEDDEEEGKGKTRGLTRSQKLVEGEEYYVDVDAYGNYVPAKRTSRVTLYEEGLENDEDEDDEEGGEGEGAKKNKEEGVAAEEARRQRRAEKDAAALDEAGQQSKWQRHHLNIDKVLNATFPVPKEKTQAKANKRDRRGALLEEDRVAMTAAAPLKVGAEDENKAAKKRTRFEDRVDDDEDDDEDDDDETLSALSEDEEEGSRFDIHEGRVDSRRKRNLVPDQGKLTTQELVRQQRKQVLQDNKELRKQKRRAKANSSTNGKGKGKEDGEFEEIPIALTDPEVRARTLAIAQKMLDPKARREILDASVNRFVFNDDDDLPDWFVKDEQRNCKVVLPVTAEEIEQQRARFRELNARPSKKVMEAMGRKRRRAQRMLRGLIDKGKADPRAREKASQLSVRKLMRSQVVKGQGKKKNKYLDGVSMGQMRRERQRLKKQKSKGKR